MNRVVILGLLAVLACALASPALGQHAPVGPPTADLPGTSIHRAAPPTSGPVPPPPALRMPPPAPQAMPAAAGGPVFAGPRSNVPGGPLSGVPQAGTPLPPPAAGPPGFVPPVPAASPPAVYVSPNPTPRAPQNLELYRPSFPEGIEAKKLSPLPSVTVREYPYLRRGQMTDKFVTPAGMEMPEEVGRTSSPKTWRDHVRDLVDPLGLLP